MGYAFLVHKSLPRRWPGTSPKPDTYLWAETLEKEKRVVTTDSPSSTRPQYRGPAWPPCFFSWRPPGGLLPVVPPGHPPPPEPPLPTIPDPQGAPVGWSEWQQGKKGQHGQEGCPWGPQCWGDGTGSIMLGRTLKSHYGHRTQDQLIGQLNFLPVRSH